MNAVDLRPRWGTDEDWTGFVLLIVPNGPLPVAAVQVERAVRARIESDSALFDLFTVARAPAPYMFEQPEEWRRALLTSLLRAAMPERHLLAPRVVLNIVVLGEQHDDIERLARELQQWEPLGRLSVFLYRCPVAADPHGESVAASTVRDILDIASEAMNAYEKQPGMATTENTFLAEVAALVEHGMVAVTVAATSPVPPVAPVSFSVPPHIDATATARVRPSPSRPNASPPREPRPAVFHRSEEVVVVDGRSRLSRLRGPAPTDAESIEWLSTMNASMSLAFLVFVPDENTSKSKTSRGYRRIALELDKLLGTVTGDAMTGRPMRVAVEVLSAITPLHKHGILRPAGELSEGDLPKTRTELYDHARTVDALINAAQRTARAFHARRTEVVGLHYIFLSSVGLPDANTTGSDWDSLLRYARATWVEIGATVPGDADIPAAILNKVPDIAPSPYGFHVVSDRYDVAALVRDESAAIYRYDSSRGPTVARGAKRNRWWRRK